MCIRDRSNTDPVIDDGIVARHVLRQSEQAGLINVLPIGSITKKLEGEELSEMAELAREGCVAFSDDGNPVMKSDVMRQDVYKRQVPTLKGKSIITVFYENSTRTRTSFDLAGRYLSADTPNLTVSTSSVQKGESLKDTIKTIEMMGPDVLVMRHSLSGAPHYVARNTSMRVKMCIRDRSMCMRK